MHDSGQRRPDSAEPFGFRDGIADPAMTLTGALRQMDAGVSRTNPPVFPVEQVLAPITLTVNGEDRPSAASYLAYIKFAQDVDAFYAASTADERAARIGRWTDGTPYGTTGHGPLPDNDYDFQAPPYDRCPASAHIRAVNPRDPHGQGRAWTIARRGVPYETPESTGLHFMAFMSSIVHQYDKMLEHAMTVNDALLTGDHQGHRYVTPLTCGYYLALPKSYFASL